MMSSDANENLMMNSLEHIARAVTSLTEENHYCAIMVLRIANFRKLFRMVSLEHQAELSDHIMTTLNDKLRKKDKVYYLNRDEYLIVLPDLRDQSLLTLAVNKINRVLGEKIHVQGMALYVKTHLGIRLVDPNYFPGPERVLQQTYSALFDAEENNCSTAHYDEQSSLTQLRNLDLETSLRQALETNELMVYYQPQYDFKESGTLSVEALSRWHHDGHNIAPADYIPIAEETGLICEITRFTVHNALRYCSQLNNASIQLSINISSRDFFDQDLFDFVKQAIETWRFDPRNLTLEITESTMMQNADHAQKALEAFHDLGIHIAIDDFGTGYSSMAYLKHFPVDELKIDQSFIRNMINDKDDEMIVKAMIHLAHDFHLKVVAEGVEDAQTLQHLRRLECDRVQGYFIAKPLSADDLKNYSSQAK